MHSISDLTIGRVFELFFDTLSKPPKPKMSVIVGMTGDRSEFATVFINTSVNMNLINNPTLQSLQIEIAPSPGYPYLKHNSFIDCSNLHTRFPESCLRELNAENGGRFLGYLPPQDLAKAIHLIKSNESLSSYKIRLYNL